MEGRTGRLSLVEILIGMGIFFVVLLLGTLPFLLRGSPKAPSNSGARIRRRGDAAAYNRKARAKLSRKERKQVLGGIRNRAVTGRAHVVESLEHTRRGESSE